MLAKRFRLGGREGFQRVFRNGQGFFSEGVGVLFLSNSVSQTRIGVAFKQKVFRRATERHLLKRRTLQAARELLGEFPSGTDCIILFQRPLADHSYPAVRKTLVSLISRLNKGKK
jgi:ribonuclease P protein component